jgi:hypothetical protein
MNLGACFLDACCLAGLLLLRPSCSAHSYTKPTHFVLELLQNADDCSYAEGLQPRVLLVVMPDAILHATNELGFTAAEVEAICAMARSTKSRKVGAFTGEKGK